jgi:hypothetical protein
VDEHFRINNKLYLSGHTEILYLPEKKISTILHYKIQLVNISKATEHFLYNYFSHNLKSLVRVRLVP